MNKYLKISNYINKILILISPFISRIEKGYYKRYSKDIIKHQPIFIIGAPRTGSTILYQALTNQLDVLYIDNLVCKFFKNLFFGFWLSNKLFNQKAHESFESAHGNTESSGLHAPSECGSYWYRWLNDENHFVDFKDITDDMAIEIRKEITAITNYFNKPLLFKNLNAGQRLRLLYKCFPDAKFIFVKREPLFTAQSILKAKRKLEMNDNDFWSIMPRNIDEIRKLDGYEQIVKQIYFLEKQIMEDSKLFSLKNFLKIDYKDLGDDFENTLRKCQMFINTNEKKEFKKAEIKLTEKLSLKDEEIKCLQNEIDKLDWESYGDK